jgi:DnaK suppressor protein
MMEDIMNKKDLVSFKKNLIQERTKLLGKKAQEIVVSSDNVGDEADIASQDTDKASSFELDANNQVIVSDINKALIKIESQDYGICESCSKKIPVDRLKIVPWVKYCVQCQEKAENSIN